MGKRKHYEKSQIIEYWFSDEGFERMFKEHKDLACRLEYNIPHCFACQRTMIDLDNEQKYGNLKNTSKNWDIKSNLEKCHIIPLALGGDDHPSNLVLLCKECHKLNPNTDDEDLYWLWMKGVEDSFFADMRNFKQAFKINTWGKNVYVKVPVTNSKGIFMGKIIKELNTKNIKLNITAIYSAKQTSKILKLINKRTKVIISIYFCQVC